MAFDDTTRGSLLRIVTQDRSLLVDEFTKQFQQDYGHVLQRPPCRSCVPAW
jgi:hypothetical protein